MGGWEVVGGEELSDWLDNIHIYTYAHTNTHTVTQIDVAVDQ